MFDNFYKDKKILITGHTGFKGSWLALWLKQLGAEVIGYSLLPPTTPNHFDLLDIDMVSIIADIRNQEKLNQVFAMYKPDIVFHLAAQSLVRLSYQIPRDTFSVNSMGTIHVLESCRLSDSVSSIVIVTSDKCYDNKDQAIGYRETDPMGGFDPYSASKGCAELITNCYRNSFFHPESYGETHHTLMASARAGNVIGGGDWARDRLVPDLVRAAEKKEPIEIRYPDSIRPWQFVLEPLSGYLALAKKLHEGETEFSGAWNFGPEVSDTLPVKEIVRYVQQQWPALQFYCSANPAALHESRHLQLDCSKAARELRWTSTWSVYQALEASIHWYQSYSEYHKSCSLENLLQFQRDAKQKKIHWALQ